MWYTEKKTAGKSAAVRAKQGGTAHGKNHLSGGGRRIYPRRPGQRPDRRGLPGDRLRQPRRRPRSPLPAGRGPRSADSRRAAARWQRLFPVRRGAENPPRPHPVPHLLRRGDGYRAGPGLRRGRLRRQALPAQRAPVPHPRPPAPVGRRLSRAAANRGTYPGQRPADGFPRGEVLALTPTEFHILYRLATGQGRILTRRQLLDAVWDFDGEFIEDNTLSVHMSRLRDKLGADGARIETVRGEGYRLL